jgi:hypothetical protein
MSQNNTPSGFYNPNLLIDYNNISPSGFSSHQTFCDLKELGEYAVTLVTGYFVIHQA